MAERVDTLHVINGGVEAVAATATCRFGATQPPRSSARSGRLGEHRLRGLDLTREAHRMRAAEAEKHRLPRVLDLALAEQLEGFGGGAGALLAQLCAGALKKLRRGVVCRDFVRALDRDDRIALSLRVREAHRLRLARARGIALRLDGRGARRGLNEALLRGSGAPRGVLELALKEPRVARRVLRAARREAPLLLQRSLALDEAAPDGAEVHLAARRGLLVRNGEASLLRGDDLELVRHALQRLALHAQRVRRLRL